MIKNVDRSPTHWEILDSVRYPGVTTGGETKRLRANESTTEAQFNNSPVRFTSTGFHFVSSVTLNSYVDYDKAGDNFIYMAIKIN